MRYYTNLIALFTIFLFSTSVYCQAHMEVKGEIIMTHPSASTTDSTETIKLIRQTDYFPPLGPPFNLPGYTTFSKWSLGLGPIPNCLLCPKKINLEFRYDSVLKGEITYQGEYNRPETNKADLLPYAYGRYQPQSFSPTIEYGTENYTIVEGTHFVDINFNENVAQNIVLTVTPAYSPSLDLSFTLSQVSISHIDENTIRIFMFAPGSSSSLTGGFSFIAYKP